MTVAATQPKGQSQADDFASAIAARAVAVARAAIGTPYVYGGESKKGFDCSGLCQYAYGIAGKSIPRTSEGQAEAGYMVVPWGSFAPGDLVFSQWPGDDASPGHVVMYEGNGMCICAEHTGTNVERLPVTTFSGTVYRGACRPAPLKAGDRGVHVDGGAGSGSSSGSGGVGTDGGEKPVNGAGAGVAVAGGIGLGALLLVGLIAFAGVAVFLLFRHRGRAGAMSSTAPPMGRQAAAEAAA